MSVTAEPTAIRPFQVDVPEEHLAELRGHFAAWEEPDLFATEMRAAFHSLR